MLNAGNRMAFYHQTGTRQEWAKTTRFLVLGINENTSGYPLNTEYMNAGCIPYMPMT